jgi:hypothetical protein
MSKQRIGWSMLEIAHVLLHRRFAQAILDYGSIGQHQGIEQAHLNSSVTTFSKA